MGISDFEKVITPSDDKIPFYKKPKLIVLILVILLIMGYWGYVQYKWDPDVNLTETQIWNGIKVNTITGDVNTFDTTEDTIKSIVSKIWEGFKEEYAEISWYEVVKSIPMKENFTLIKLTIVPTTDKERLNAYLSEQLKLQGKTEEEIDELVKRLKEVSVYDTLTKSLKNTLDSKYWKIMTKGMYIVIEKRWNVIIPQRVGDYVKSNFYNQSFTQTELGWFSVITDYLNYQGAYKSTNENIWDMLSLNEEVKGKISRDNLMNIFIKISESPSFSSLKPFLENISSLYE